ncbi:FecR family protein [Dyadobacter sp. Leaf189]|uniref:FecR family protein n=1 Tax=Dyadobacter sp. Leaf189 TaxID=1736295 RepID=UPI0006FFBD71|nr:FecR family protein [Dyadobacter sp. Leaf189]KQS33863.1 hypothetical protein ASG33_07420 [Dyadobacter sp. Leaf189]
MSKQNFYHLLDRYRSGDCTDKEKRLVEQWFAMLDEPVPVRSEQENSEIEERIWNAIMQNDTAEPVQPAVSFPMWRWAAAAVMLIGIAFGSYKAFYKNSNSRQVTSARQGESRISHSNQSQNEENITLPDGSTLILSPGSKISYPAGLAGKNRVLHLTGKAFFRISRDTERPFLVHSGEVVTKVLGTSFWVEGRENNTAIEVSVVSGKVSVSKNELTVGAENSKIKDGVILTANQRVKYSVQTHAFETGLIANPQPVNAAVTANVPAVEAFIFRDTPFTDVIAKLEKSFGVEIILENDAMKSCLFTADMTQEPLFTKLDLLCASVNASYEVRGTRILISGKGCSSPQ